MVKFQRLLQSLIVFAFLPIARAQVPPEELRIENLQFLSATELEITLAGPTNRVFVLEVSTNLLQWRQFDLRQPDAVGSDGRVILQVAPVEDSRRGFYRAFHLAPGNEELLDQLEGPADQPANGYLPDLGMPGEAVETLLMANGQQVISGTHLLVIFRPDTTVGQINEFLSSYGAQIAGSIPNMDVVAIRIPPAASVGDLDLAVKDLKNSGLFQAVAVNIALTEPTPVEPEPIPQLNRVGQEPAQVDWAWDLPALGTGTGGNNAMEMSRIPQLWNWQDYGRRQVRRNGTHGLSIMEYDFYNSHEDLPSNIEPLGPAARGLGDHGVGVLGVAAANGTNTIGIQGVTPFADPVRAVVWQINNTAGHAFAGRSLGDIAAQICRTTPSRVINVSSGIRHRSDPLTNAVSTATTTTWSTWMDDMGDLWTGAFQSLSSVCGDQFLIITSAGNDGVDTRYNHPIANIACRQDLNSIVPNFLTVENVQGDGTTSPSSNRDVITVGDVAGHAVSAGGSNVGLLGNSNTSAYKINSGTSFSAPFVAGLASYLWTLDPDLSVRQLKTLLMSPDAPRLVPGSTSDLVDGYAAALHIDKLRGTRKLQKALVDVDDGTMDGNLRKNGLPFEDNPNSVHTPDKRRGDGAIDMSDFRAFRDAFLDAQGVTTYLDGTTAHFKRDLNFDGAVNGQPVSPDHPADVVTPSSVVNALDENVYPRYDFNGNGRIDPGNLLTAPGASDVAPVRADPDIACAGRDPGNGCLLDLDVLLDPVLWEVTEENVLVEGGDFFALVPGNQPPPLNWGPLNIRMTNLYGGVLPVEYAPFLWSCDIHLSVEETDPNAAYNIPDANGQVVQADGLWITSAGIFGNSRSGDWQGVLTLPVYHPDFNPTGSLPVEGQGVTVQYKKTLGDEWHQYRFAINPGPGEDVLLELGFDKLKCSSTKREQDPAFLPRTGQLIEMLAKLPGAAPYTSQLIPDTDLAMADDIATQMAEVILQHRLRLPALLGASGQMKGAYQTERVDDETIRIDLVGIWLNYLP